MNAEVSACWKCPQFDIKIRCIRTHVVVGGHVKNSAQRINLLVFVPLEMNGMNDARGHVCSIKKKAMGVQFQLPAIVRVVMGGKLLAY